MSSPSHRLAESLKSAHIYDLGQMSHPGMPQLADAPRLVLTMHKRHGDVMREDGLSSANDLLVTVTHAGTHIDAVGHISVDGMLFGDISAAEAQHGAGGLRTLGIESVRPVVTRGVLLDVASLYGVDHLPAAKEITAAELAEAATRANVDLGGGDAVLIRTGWGNLWDQPEAYIRSGEGMPGPGVEAAEWLTGHAVSLVGSDTMMFEVFRSGRYALPVHAHLMRRHGVLIVENMNLELLAADKVFVFGLIVLPLKLKGATGSPVRPVAVATR